MSEKINLKGGIFILAHSFRVFSPWLLGSIAEEEDHSEKDVVEQSCSSHSS
jgi:hypothetical protein